ncbi:hypothetical protein Ahy_A06g030642 [Arachis hypogaea]|uniref:Protein kinase domain-containing protein n=1 Tax=Arachis hypogaea TaxID=3818 RepID=A0A445CWY3_ARAHY|nr:hypothetical protein Ahy_A06g030642 [Arachis hypogaea]
MSSSTKKTTWKSMMLILSCCNCKSECNLEMEEEEESEKKKLKQGSFQRLCLSDVSNSSSSQAIEDLSVSLAGSKLYAFTLEELREATNNFSWSNMLGEGGFGPVYKGFFDDKLRHDLKPQTVAVKRLDLEGLQGHREWLKVLRPVIKKAGYSAAMPWSTRMKIALGAAKGLAFLHGADKPVIYRDFKASNILLDSDFTAKLSDFGLAKDGPEGEDTHVTTRIMGTHGYAAPEYIMTGHLTTKSDVYSYGVVLLELITGKRVVDKSLTNRGKSLVGWARPMLRDSKKLKQIIDKKLEGQFPMKGAMKVASLAYRCLCHHPNPRPTMSDVVKTLEPLQDFDDIFLRPFVYVATNQNGNIDTR